jgi:Fic family protein
LNILQTFKEFNASILPLKNLNKQYFLKLHAKLTRCLDIFQKYLSGFDLYHSGKFRASNKIMVGNYLPPDYHEIDGGLEQLIKFIKKDASINKIAIFHTALYALHPFANGNKRVNRVLEHVLFRAADMNQKNLYSTSYYYHLEKERYYKNLLLSLQRKNLNYFVSFIQEALFFSLISIVKTSIEAQRIEFLTNKALSVRLNQICAPLVKQKTMQYKTLFKISRAKLKLAEQTFVNDLKKAVDDKILFKQEDGKKVYYSLNLTLPEEKWYRELIAFAKTRLSYIPPRFSQTI